MLVIIIMNAGAAALLHNFIVDERENSEGNNDDATVTYLDDPSLNNRSEVPNPMATDNNNEPNTGGRHIFRVPHLKNRVVNSENCRNCI